MAISKGGLNQPPRTQATFRSPAPLGLKNGVNSSSVFRMCKPGVTNYIYLTDDDTLTCLTDDDTLTCLTDDDTLTCLTDDDTLTCLTDDDT